MSLPLYRAEIFKVHQPHDEHEGHHGFYFLYILKTESGETKTFDSTYAKNLSDLLSRLIDHKKEQGVLLESVSTIPAIERQEMMGWTRLPIPVDEFLPFIDKYVKQTKGFVEPRSMT